VKNSTVGDTTMENCRKNEEDFRRFIRESLVARAMNFFLQSWMNWFLRTFVDWYMGEASLAFAVRPGCTITAKVDDAPLLLSQSGPTEVPAPDYGNISSPRSLR